MWPGHTLRLHEQYIQNGDTGNLQDLNDAIIAWRQYILFTSDDDPSFASALSNLSILLMTRFDKLAEITDVDEACATTRVALRFTSEGSQAHRRLSLTLQYWLSRRSEFTGRPEDVDEAITIAQKALHTPDNQKTSPAELISLANRFYDRFTRSKQLQDLENAVSHIQQAIQDTPVGEPQCTALCNLSLFLEGRYKMTAKREDLSQALAAAHQVIKLTPEGHPNTAHQILQLALLLRTKYSGGGRMNTPRHIEDLKKIISITEKAMSSSQYDHLSWMRLGDTLGALRMDLHMITGDIPTLNEAISLYRHNVRPVLYESMKPAMMIPNSELGVQIHHQEISQALDPRPIVDLHEPAESMNLRVARLLGQASLTLFASNRTGDSNALDESIHSSSQAMALLPEGHSMRPKAMFLIISAHFERYARMHLIEDLYKATTLARQILPSSLDDDDTKMHPSYLLANCIELKNQRFEDRQGVLEAINEMRGVVKDSPPSGLFSSTYICLLSSMLLSSYDPTKNLSDLDDTIDLLRQIISAENQGDANFSHTLSHALLRRYDRTSDVIDLYDAEEQSRLSIQCLPDDHPARAGALAFYAQVLGRLFLETRDKRILAKAMIHCKEAWESFNATPWVRMYAGSLSVKIAGLLGKIEFGIEVGRGVIDLFAKVPRRFLNWSDEQFAVSSTWNVGSNLCGLFLSADRIQDAIQYLEQGRTVIIKSLNKPIQDVGYNADGLVLPDTSASLLKARNDLDACLEEIRSTTGQDHFLLSEELSDIQQCATDGCIVIVNVTDFRSDAIPIFRHRLVSLPLHGMIAKKVNDWLEKDWTTRKRSEKREKNEEFLVYLSWLWRVCVKQIVDKISAVLDKDEGLPRVW
ncbi:hypothetical protein PT974_01568 [Cladobotryum mycophilum]|uniref:CHAT domain-containing protein n=1 Tax=Cladobotryum mycophilum TaxID=491253 RepID=A0ABR0T432_9HYPO